MKPEDFKVGVLFRDNRGGYYKVSRFNEAMHSVIIEDMNGNHAGQFRVDGRFACNCSIVLVDKPKMSFEDFYKENPYKLTRSFTEEDWKCDMRERWLEEYDDITQ